MELEKIFESILREGFDDDLAAYNKANDRYNRQRRTTYSLGSNEENRLYDADGTKVKLSCGNYELEVVYTPSIGRLRLNGIEFDAEETAKLTADEVAGAVIEDVLDHYFRITGGYTNQHIRFNYKNPNHNNFIKAFSSVLEAAPSVLAEIKSLIAKAGESYTAAKTAYDKRARNIDSALANRSAKVDALYNKLTPESYKAEHPFGVGTVVDGWTVKDINEADGTVKMVSPSGAIRNKDLETVMKNWEANIKNREIPWHLPYSRRFNDEK